MGSFVARVISRNGDANWPSKLCDLTSLDFFLRGDVKNRNNPETNTDFKAEIIQVIAKKYQHLCKNVLDNFDKILI